MLLVGAAEVDGFTDAVTTQRIDDDWWWYVAYIVLVVVGIVAQARLMGGWRAPIRDRWEQSSRPAAV